MFTSKNLMAEQFTALIARLVELPRRVKTAIAFITDAGIINVSLLLAVVIRTPEEASALVTANVGILFLGATFCSLTAWVNLGLYKTVLRYLDIRALSTIFVCSFTSSVLLATFLFLSQASFPRSIPIIYFALLVCLLAGSRLVVRGLLESRSGARSERVIIYGAGSAGRQLCVALQNGVEFQPVALVDDDKSLQNRRVLGVRVWSPKKLPSLVEKTKTSRVLFAIPSVSKAQKAAIFNEVQKLGVELLTIPSSADLVSGSVSVSSLRSLDIEDLLGRDVVAPSTELLNDFAGKAALITGAGGSIGSELARQVSQLGCDRLILLEQSEYQLYTIERELAADSDLELVPVLGSVLDESLLDRLFEKYQIDIVYHAAAYKHVPLVELNSAAGVRTNVRGTQAMAKAALRHNAERFVLISTDKAVRPTNVMGASKRLAELVVQGMAERSGSTVFSMVRFGNVLGSSGSVVPLFKSQIEQGGPVTVTHPEITRYFMTIPEAASLVLQAGTMASGGEVFVLDMGQPVKVLDLAHKVIRLMGATVKHGDHPEGDIAIEYTGLRPGEKLYEELLVGDNARGTDHPRIMCADESHLDLEELLPILESLETCLRNAEFRQAREILQRAPLGYQPVSEVADLLAKSESSPPQRNNEGNVTFLSEQRIKDF